MANDGIAKKKSLKDKLLSTVDVDDVVPEDDNNYGGHLPGAGEGSDNEEDEHGEPKKEYKLRKAKVKTFFGIPKVRAATSRLSEALDPSQDPLLRALTLAD